MGRGGLPRGLVSDGGGCVGWSRAKKVSRAGKETCGKRRMLENEAEEGRKMGERKKESAIEKEITKV